MAHFGFFPLIRHYAETALLIDVKYIFQKASYTAQQNSGKVASPKTCIRKNIFA